MDNIELSANEFNSYQNVRVGVEDFRFRCKRLNNVSPFGPTCLVSVDTKNKRKYSVVFLKHEECSQLYYELTA